MSQPIYLNNCHKFQHNLEWTRQAPTTAITGMQVFFDLRLDQQSDLNKMRSLIGQECCVFKKFSNSEVHFILNFYKLLHVDETASTIIDKEKTFHAFGLRGTPVKKQTGRPRENEIEMLKPQLKERAPFLFNINNHLKRRSVLYP